MFPYNQEIGTPFFNANYGNNTFDYETLLPPPASTDAVAKSAAKRRGKRNDRHSKIRTAQGLRDRRMRLSVDVASRFFALQDTLGFDRASATVDWLLEQSKPSIERLRVGAPAVVYEATAAAKAPSVSRRNSRAEARARARSRTIKKKNKMLVASLSNVDSNLPIVPGDEFMIKDYSLIRDYNDTMNFFQEEFNL